ncbi:MAG: hypothetical protein ACQEV7_07715 [Bacillota bacterium]
MTNVSLNDKISDIRARTKAGALTREERIAEVDRAIEAYFAKTGNMPDDKALERLADLLLYEELTDTDRMKVRNNEYPFFSDTQLARRQEGKHVRSTAVTGEVPLGASESYGVDGRNYSQPTRRVRNTRENRFVDKEAKIRNDERRKAYAEFTKVQPVDVRNISE